MTNEIIVVLEAQIDDEVIQHLKMADDSDIHLKEIIDAYEIVLSEKGIEIFDRGNDFLICEDAIYIAVYEDEFEENK
jgi:hypothetical protein